MEVNLPPCGTTDSTGRHPELRSDKSARDLDDRADRDELRERYYGLLQELRVLLPGVQILVAFLLTVPFATGWARTDGSERDLYGVALGAGVLSVVAFVAPTAFHRVGPRQSRSVRLVWGIRLIRFGLVLLGVSLTASVAVVADLVFGPAASVAASLAAIGAMVALWVVLPIGTGRPGEPLQS